jgi:hypothetical protein
MTPSRRTDKAVSDLWVLARDTMLATRGDIRLDRIDAAQRGIERSPCVEQLLRDYTDAIFRNTERILKDIRARTA